MEKFSAAVVGKRGAPSESPPQEKKKKIELDAQIAKLGNDIPSLVNFMVHQFKIGVANELKRMNEKMATTEEVREVQVEVGKVEERVKDTQFIRRILEESVGVETCDGDGCGNWGGNDGGSQ